MVSNEDLETIIRRHVFLGKKSPQGYEIIKCNSCNDYKERAGFKFESGVIQYHCFNCSIHAVYDANINRRKLSVKMNSVLNSFGIPETEIQKSLFFNTKIYEKLKPQDIKTSLPTQEIKLPEGSVLVNTDDSVWCEVAREYLKIRNIDSSKFYVTDHDSYAGRLIIPYYFKGKLIYWQGRALDESIEPRYKNPTVEKDNIFFNMDEVYRYTNEPLFVTEGATDSLSIGNNAVSILGSTLTEFRFRELRKAASHRKVIFVIDKNKPGYKLGLKVLQEEGIEWYINVFPKNIEDSNDALNKTNRLWMVTHLTSTAVKGFQGKLLLEMRCKNGI